MSLLYMYTSKHLVDNSILKNEPFPLSIFGPYITVIKQSKVPRNIIVISHHHLIFVTQQPTTNFTVQIVAKVHTCCFTKEYTVITSEIQTLEFTPITLSLSLSCFLVIIVSLFSVIYI